ncbi:alpha/beta fold hydrolase [Microbacterium sp. CIAB417]|uniref:alpha/beta fold hydrolase n=1 Tax=Microbacterium sp. CIAB417 TaxID=2860287 RepID=UPI001FADE43C|nr:alpha/beta hydrolase [Microbacterium sp. CIAB417]
MDVPTDISEFRYLPAQAEAIGVRPPAAERIGFTLSGGRTLSALRFGDGDPRVVLLHGAGLNAHTWDTTILRLGVPALAIDLAGHGDSSWRDDVDYSARTLAADIAEALPHWSHAPVVLVGQSLGGLTAAALASAHPELVRDVIVVDITPGIDASGPAALREFFRVSDFADRDELVERALAFGLGGSREDTERGVFFNSRIREDGRVEWKHHFAHLAARVFAEPQGGSAAPGAVLSTDGWDDLAGVSAPLTLVRATRGYVTSADADDYRRRLPRADLVEIDATHNVQETAPDVLADLIRSRVNDGM